MIEVLIQRLPHYPREEDLPQYMSPLAAGVDLRAAMSSVLTLSPGQRSLVPTGIALAIPEGYEAQLRPRSGLALKKGISLPNSPGTIDADYRGEIQVALINLGSEAVVIEPGERIAQMIFCPVVRAGWREVSELPPTTRGAGGFGHTGTR